jgi:hypothetical protein
MNSISPARLLSHVTFAVCIFGTAYAARSYFLFHAAIVPSIQVLRPAAKDRAVEAVQRLLPASGPNASASGLVASIASERNLFFESWASQAEVHATFARNQLLVWLAALACSLASLWLSHRKPKHVP